MVISLFIEWFFPLNVEEAFRQYPELMGREAVWVQTSRRGMGSEYQQVLLTEDQQSARNQEAGCVLPTGGQAMACLSPENPEKLMKLTWMSLSGYKHNDV